MMKGAVIPLRLLRRAAIQGLLILRVKHGDFPSVWVLFEGYSGDRERGFQKAH